MGKKNILEHYYPYEVILKYDCLYKSPKDRQKKCLGPLVFYPDTYFDDNGEEKNYVGFEYYNIALIKRSPEIKEYFSNLLIKTIKETNHYPPPYRLIAAQEDFVLAATTADKLQCPVSFFEKKESDPFHSCNVQSGENIILFKDVCNNSSTTKKMIDTIKSAGGNVVAVVCIINCFNETSFFNIPILSTIYIPTPQYRQDDPEVKKLMEEYNFVSEPEENWSFLQKEMRRGVK